MNWTRIEGHWEQVKGDVKSAWAKLTDDDIGYVGGKLDKLVGKIVERYGVKKEQALHQVTEWADRLTARIDAIARVPEPPYVPGARDAKPHGKLQDRPSTPRH
jgi:uncharacterized protein YjbJ (UPF0337 family)